MILEEAINNIITESINSLILEKKHHKKPKKYDQEDDYDRYKDEKIKHRKRMRRIKKRKLAGGGFSDYDYDTYERNHKKLSKSDADSVLNDIDVDAMNKSEIASDLMPTHTRGGGASQLIKILNHKRPLTKPMASKISKMKANGQIPTK